MISTIAKTSKYQPQHEPSSCCLEVRDYPRSDDMRSAVTRTYVTVSTYLMPRGAPAVLIGTSINSCWCERCEATTWWYVCMYNMFSEELPVVFCPLVLRSRGRNKWIEGHRIPPNFLKSVDTRDVTKSWWRRGKMHCLLHVAWTINETHAFLLGTRVPGTWYQQVAVILLK